MKQLSMIELLDVFNEIADKTKQALGETIEIISSERVPSQQSVENLNVLFNELKTAYNDIDSLAQSLIPVDEMPENGCPVFEFDKAVRNSQSIQLKKQLHSVKSMLSLFVNVKSSVLSCSQALLPFQDEAQNLLKEIQRVSGNEQIKKIIDAAFAPKLFMKTLETENLNSDIGMGLLDKVSEYFPARVQLGLAMKSYFILSDVSVESVEVQIKSSSKDSTDLGKESVQSNSFLKKTQCNDKSIFPSQSTVNIENDIENSYENEQTDINQPGHPVLLKSISKIKTSNPSASSFKKLIIKMAKPIRCILPLFTNLGILTGEQIFKFGICMDCFSDDMEELDSVTKALDSLVNKGVVASYIMEDSSEIAYCLTGYGMNCLQKESISKQMESFWYISIGNLKVYGGKEINADRLKMYVERNKRLLEYLYGIKSGMKDDDYFKVKQSIKLKEDHYEVAVVFNMELFVCELQNTITDIVNTSYESILIVSDELDKEIHFSDKCKRVFLYNAGIISKYDIASGILIPDEVIVAPNPDLEKNKMEEDSCTQSDEDVIVDTGVQSTNEISTENADMPIENLNQYDEMMDIDKISSGEELCTFAENLAANIDTPSEKVFYGFIHKLLDPQYNKKIGTSSVVQPLLLAKTAALVEGNHKCKEIYQQLLLATNLIPSECIYTSENLASVFPNLEDADDCLALSSYLYALLVPNHPYDYGLKSWAEQVLCNFDMYFPALTTVKPLFSKLIEVQEIIPSGFTPSIIALLGDAAEDAEFIKGLQEIAKDLFIVAKPKTRMIALPKMYSACFGPQSDFYACMEIISANKTNDYPLVATVLSEYCTIQDGIYLLDQDKIEEKLDKAWDDVNPRKHYLLEYGARTSAIRHFQSRLNLMKTWVEHVENIDKGTLDIERLRTLKNEIIKLSEKTTRELKGQTIENSNVLVWMIKHIKACLSGRESQDIMEAFSELLCSGVISLDDQGLPIIDEQMTSIKYYEPWRSVLNHIKCPIYNFELAKSELLDDSESNMFDNLRQLEMIGKIRGTQSDDFVISDQQKDDAKKAADAHAVGFQETLELAYTYNRINEVEKENLSAVMTYYKNRFFGIQDFGCWKQFIQALTKQIDELAAARKVKLRHELDLRLKRNEGNTSAVLNEAETLLERDMNFAVAEEYINRFDNGEVEITDKLQNILHDTDSFSDFISDDVFIPLYRDCQRNNGRSLKTFGWEYIEKKLPKDWTSRLKDDSKKLVTNWPGRKSGNTSVQFKKLFECIGLSVNTINRIPASKDEIYDLYLNSTARSMADYRHPISAFGTQTKSPMKVVLLYGNYTAKQLVDTITSKDFGGIAIVLIDRPIDRTARRQIAEIFHTQTSGQNPFILIDQVLALYLAMHQVTERLPIMLKCTLPYTTYQPFVRDGGSTADEMFCGRLRELATIIDPNGACVVYGGRQLGKTALLERAESRCFNPENKAYAVYSNIINCDSEEALVFKIIEDIKKKTSLAIKPCDTLKKLCAQFHDLFQKKQMESMLLLLDEADNFLGAISKENYKTLQPLIDLKRETKNNFKFVLAGLHNVCRAQNATSRNGVFGQLGTPLCVKPLSPTDALQLLSRPLRYLGFQIDRYPHLETILTNTNYYPGILQFFGYMLVETLTGEYKKYYQAVDGNPPFTLQDEQLGSVMNSADLNRSIKDKFRWSLELDPRYFMLARCIAVLYYFQDKAAGNWLGYSIREIMEISSDYDIHCLENEDEHGYMNLLDEMVEMGILSKPEDDLYRLRRSSFISIIGNNYDTVDADINNNNKELR